MGCSTLADHCRGEEIISGQFQAAEGGRPGAGPETAGRIARSLQGLGDEAAGRPPQARQRQRPLHGRVLDRTEGSFNT